MKAIKGLTMRKLGNENILVAESPELLDFDRIVTLNDSAAYIWTNIQDRTFDADTVVGILTNRYDIDAATALEDAVELLDTWKKAGIIVD